MECTDYIKRIKELYFEQQATSYGMKMREPWKKQMKQIAKDLSDLTALTNTNNIACTAH